MQIDAVFVFEGIQLHRAAPSGSGRVATALKLSLPLRFNHRQRAVATVELKQAPASVIASQASGTLPMVGVATHLAAFPDFPIPSSRRRPQHAAWALSMPAGGLLARRYRPVMFHRQRLPSMATSRLVVYIGVDQCPSHPSRRIRLRPP